ncbi:MAG: CAAD domain-containing protein [Xenococcaceae cyanobacterium]|jgi:CAAD domains of cyanobacterial aminoacyl-tRNA synthetase
MESQAQQGETTQQTSGFNTESPGMMTKSNASGEQSWQEYVQPVVESLSKLPDNVGKIFSEYQQPIVTLGLIFGGIVSVKITLAILDAINSIPLLSPMFELVGIGYTGWFVYRYLWKESTRQELVKELDSLKSQVMGRNV